MKKPDFPLYQYHSPPKRSTPAPFGTGVMRGKKEFTL